MIALLLPRRILTCFLAMLSTLLVVTPVAAYVAPIATHASPRDLPLHKRIDDEPDFTLNGSSAKVQALLQLGIQPQQACEAAETRASQDVNGTIWFLGGCLFGLLGLGAAYIIEPSPPASALVGQDEVYVAEYTDCYTDAGQGIQKKQALTGCLIGTAATVLLYALVVAAAVSTSDDF